MFIDSNQRRINIHAKLAQPAFDSNGFQHDTPDTQEIRDLLGITEIPDPVRESDETHYNQEIDEAPYLISTPKPEWMLQEAHNAKIQTQITALENEAISNGLIRTAIEELLKLVPAGTIPHEKMTANAAARAALRTQFVQVVGKPEPESQPTVETPAE